jgi:trimeric autotransporter adhesin
VSVKRSHIKPILNQAEDFCPAGFFASSRPAIRRNNTALGWSSLGFNVTSSFNTAIGAGALFANTAYQNTATGAGALLGNTTGAFNTANGALALLSNTTGNFNTANGFHALYHNITGIQNTAIGEGALFSNTTGNYNTANGVNALLNGNFSNNNIALGAFAGSNVFSAEHVICIDAEGANVSNTTWIGSVYGVTTQSDTTTPVVVSNTGQLGTVASSERFKKDIATMENASEAILSLRPVTFHYKTDTKGTPQFGLIAEEVAKVNPALVLLDKEGKPYSVRYDQVNAMLLNEFLKEHRKNEQQEATIARLEQQIEALTAGLRKVSAQVELSKPAPQVVNNP